MQQKYTQVLENKYGIIKVVGKGEFGEVYMAQNLQTEVAIKQALKSELERVKKRQELFQTEKKIMEMIKNDNVISLIDHIETKEKHYLVMEYCNNGDLDSYVKGLKAQSKKPLDEEQARVFLKQLLNGFRGLHELFVIHRDLKLKNILVHGDTLKIADFGLSKVGELGVTHVGTPYTKAPEVFKGKGRIRYNNKADIWSLGVIFYQLLYDLKYPFTGQNEKDLFDNIERARDLNFAPKGINVQVSDEAKRLLRRMMTKDPALRITWNELYTDPYLNMEQKDVSSFDPLYQEVMTKFQVIRTLQCKIMETLGNSELLRNDFKVITNLNQYYVQFMLSKRVMILSRMLSQQIGILRQSPKYITKALNEFIKETEDNQFVYQMYFENTKYNLERFLNNRKLQSRECEDDIQHELSNRSMGWPYFLRIVLNYYYCLSDLAQQMEDRNQMKALQLYEHILDLLRCLENDSAFEGDKLKQKSQSGEEINEVKASTQQFDSMMTTDQYIGIQKLNVQELYIAMFTEQ